MYEVHQGLWVSTSTNYEICKDKAFNLLVSHFHFQWQHFSGKAHVEIVDERISDRSFKVESTY